MERTMRAYRLVEWQRAPEIVEVPIPTPAPHDVRVKVAGTGLCHSDLTIVRMPAAVGDALGWEVPFTLGHEVAGWVDEVGAAVDGVAPGDPVALVSPHSCGECRACRRGDDNLCLHGARGRGYGADGGLAEYVLARAPRDLLRLVDVDPVRAGPLTDAGATSHHAVARVLPRLAQDGATAVVVGAGGLGCFAVQILRAISDARVMAVDINPSRLDYAREVGAHDTLDGVSDATVAEIRDLTDGVGADAVLDFVGDDATIAAGIGALRPGGAYGLVGAGGGSLRRPWLGALPDDGEIFTFQGSTIADARAVIDLAESARIRSDVDVYDVERIADAYAALESGTLRGRAVVVFES
jgi:propanol-preferring alcohol dehydrogenase